jgi:transposase
MSKCASKQPKSWREGRRLRAWELSQQGWSQREIAHALGVTEGAVSQWLARARQAGSTALHDQPRPGRSPRLSPEEEARVLARLGEGASAAGFRGDRWTRKRICAVIRRECGVTYHPGHISRLVRRWHWSRQKPVRLARQRNEAAIQEWREKRYPALRKRGGG